MTVGQMATRIGQNAVLEVKGMRVFVEVTDVRQVWGKVQYQITPVVGEGSTWVDESSIVFVSRTPANA
jgi:hypothetical protein